MCSIKKKRDNKSNESEELYPKIPVLADTAPDVARSAPDVVGSAPDVAGSAPDVAGSAPVRSAGSGAHTAQVGDVLGGARRSVTPPSGKCVRV